MRVTFDFGTLASAVSGTPDYSPVAKAVLESSAVMVAAVQAAYSGVVLAGMTRKVVNSNAANAIHASIDGLFAFRVQTPEEPEQPVAPYDMKPALLRGPRHRVTKDGKPYTIVPFVRKGSDLPEAMAEMAAKLKISRITRRYLEVRADDQWEVLRNRYKWGDNLGALEDKRYSNLYRFGKDKYLTFRTVSTRSAPNSWIHPALPANPITEAAWNAVAPAIEAALVAAWEKAVTTPWQS